MVFGLGLLHGLSFTGMLLPLGVAEVTMWQSLIGFNIGVELGQLLIVAVVFPILLMLSHWSQYVNVILRGGSVALILVAAYWFGERAIVYVGRMFA